MTASNCGIFSDELIAHSFILTILVAKIAGIEITICCCKLNLNPPYLKAPSYLRRNYQITICVSYDHKSKKTGLYSSTVHQCKTCTSAHIYSKAVALINTLDVHVEANLFRVLTDGICIAKMPCRKVNFF